MQNKLLSYIKRHRLFSHGDRVLVAVSGGADSVALLLVLHELAGRTGISLAVAHLNHCIRGKDSDADAEFVRKLALRLGVPFYGGKENVPRLARREGISMEMAARKARYDFLLAAARGTKADVIATAHTADDQAETVLLKLARGAGSRGLSGIPRLIMMNGFKIIRPMLDIRRNEIEEYLARQKQKWREDKSNIDPAYKRNRVRHQILPFLENKLNPDIRAALIRTADLLREEDKWLEELSLKKLTECSDRKLSSVLLVDRLRRECVAARRRVLRLWLSSAGITPELIDYDVVTRIEALLDEKGTGSMEIAGDWIVKQRYNRLIVEKRQLKPVRSFRRKIKVPGKTIIAEANLKIETSLDQGLVKDSNLHVGSIPAMASLRLPESHRKKIIARSWRNGDRMKPFGMTGSKKLHNIFIDAKVPVEERNKIPVFECDGEIIWIPGYRVARGWEIKDPSLPAIQISVQNTDR